MTRPLRILYLEDSEMDVILTKATLDQEVAPYDLIWAKRREEFEAGLRDPAVDLVLSDFRLPRFDGMAALKLCREQRPLTPFILISGTVGEEMAVECLRQGATDYVLKGSLRRLPMVVRRAMAEVEERSARMKVDEERQSLLEAASVARVVPWKQAIETKLWTFGESTAVMLGYSAAELSAEPALVEALIHAEDVHRLVSARSRSASGAVTGFDCRMRHKDGRWIWTRWTLAMKPGLYQGVLQDISELHATQEQLVKSQKAEAAGLLVSGLSHDFNNHITAILANADMLGTYPLSEPEQKHVANILRAGERSRELVRQLLGFARRNQSSHRNQENLNILIHEAAGLLKHALRPDIRLEMALAGDLEDVRVDAGQIIQAVMNLGLNAQDAISGEGRITLRTGVYELAGAEAEAHDREPGPYVFFEVEDTGSGIPPEMQGKIFDPYFTTKGQGKGTGLGLAMVQAIVKGHDGLLFCFSEVGEGTRFRMLLPLARSVVPFTPIGMA